jgi:hypothetical protein
VTSRLRITTSIFFSQLDTCGHSSYVTSSLTRGWACRLQLLLVLASAVILGSQSRGSQDHILLSQIRDSPTLEVQVPDLYPPGAGWPAGQWNITALILYFSMYSRCYAIGEYTVTVSEQRLRKHVPAETNTQVTIDWQWKRDVACVVRAAILWAGQFEATGQLSCERETEKRWRCCWQFNGVLHRRLWQEGLSAWKWRISTVRAVARERLMTQQAGKKLSVCCGDL